jgi:exonuclease SbcD
MSIQLIHVSDIHFGSGESHGRINPSTGLNIRFEDFVQALSKVVDFAIEKSADAFIFSGDAYKNASPEPLYQMMFAKQVKRLSDAGIQTVLLVGNHDQMLKTTASHALSVFQTLEIPNVLVIDNPTTKVIDTKSGAFQLIGLPYVTKHLLLTHDKYNQLPAQELDRVLVEHVDTILKGFYQELCPDLPTVVTAHMTLDRALAGIEQELLVGYNLTYPTDIFIENKIDYVALGHVHKHQIIRADSPAIVYAGSLERVDFGEEKEDKGFVSVELKRGKTTYEFHSINPRPFITLDIDLSDAENPTEILCHEVTKRVPTNSVARIRYKIKQEKISQIDEDKVRASAANALSIRLLPDIIQTKRQSRMPQLTESVSPMTALAAYLTELAPERKDVLIARAKELMARAQDGTKS